MNLIMCKGKNMAWNKPKSLKKDKTKTKLKTWHEKSVLDARLVLALWNLWLSVFPNQSGNHKNLVFVVVYRPPGPYSEFLSEFSEFLSQLVPSTDKVIAVGDFNIHVDVENDSLNINFNSII